MSQPARRRALVVGINSYPGFGRDSLLQGAVRDAEVMAALLMGSHGFRVEDLTLILESDATRERLLAELWELRRRTVPGDSILFYYSGHGSQMTDREGDEGDGLDETIVPFDSGRGQHDNRDITDDEIHRWATHVLEITPHLTLIFDCCHAATLHRPIWKIRSVPPDLRAVDELPPSPLLASREVVTPRNPTILAACHETELALELPAAVAGTARGAFSYGLTQVLARSRAADLTWRGVMERVQDRLAVHQLDQRPELSGEGLDEPIFSTGANELRSTASAPGLEPCGPGLGPAREKSRLGEPPSAAHLWLALADRMPGELDRSSDLRWTIYRSHRGPWHRLDEEEVLEVGQRLRVDIRHSHRSGLNIYLLDIGILGKLTLLFPELDGRETLDPGPTLTVGDRRGDRLDLVWPEAAPPELREGIGHLLLVASPSRLRASEILAAHLPDIRELAILRYTYRMRQPQSSQITRSTVR